MPRLQPGGCPVTVRYELGLGTDARTYYVCILRPGRTRLVNSRDGTHCPSERGPPTPTTIDH